jgi:outer membrane protein OmpA-like peptidoglycan-associated protein
MVPKAQPEQEHPQVTSASPLRVPDEPVEKMESVESDGLTELRNLLLAPEQAQLAKLQERLNETEFRAEEVGQVLPEAIRLASSRNRELSTALTPVVEEGIQASVKRDPKILVNAIFPLLGPAIRKAIAATLGTMIQSLNQTLEESFSIQGLKWRIEAFRAGKSFAEVVLLHTLLYRVEQVLLIHKKTGLLLQHVVNTAVPVQDADMVSGMLTAIQDFVHDSFNLKKEEALETMQVGELTVWIEPGPEAVLVGVIRGNAPYQLRSIFQETIESIHRQHGSLLTSFQGNSAAFEICRPDLESRLQVQYASHRKKPTFVPLLVIAGLMLGAVGLWSFLSARSHQRWRLYLERLRAEPGLLVVAAEESWGKYSVSGLRDPLAVDPSKLLKETNIDAAQVISRWQPFQSAVPQFVLARAKSLLNPPGTVTLQFENGILRAVGAAPQEWITESRRLAPFISGVAQFQHHVSVDSDVSQTQSLKKQIEKQAVHFVEGGSQFVPNEEEILQTLVEEVRRMQKAARSLKQTLHLEIRGHTDGSGSEQMNRRLGQRRADRVLQFLVSRGFERAQLAAVSTGTNEPATREITESDRALNRRVTFHVTLMAKAEGRGSRP